MKSLKYTFSGFLGFLLVTMFDVTIALTVYSLIEDKEMWKIALLMLIVVLVNTFLCSLVDYFRRRIFVEKPLKEILSATDQMTKGNFEVELKVYHTYPHFDNYDWIKEDLNKMAKELSKSEILKNDFIANVSHEIKTPLMIIQSYADELQNANLSEEEKNKYSKDLQSACRRLNLLVMNILKLNKLENQKLSLEITRFDLSELLTAQVLQFEEIIEEKKIELTCDIQEDVFIQSVPGYLEIVFNNLMSNAIKFTETQGKIYVSLKQNQDEYTICFKDDGCGMDSETGRRIFDKFYQGDTSHAKEGNGLGLALVKKVIDLLGGTIRVESELHKGTNFEIVLKEVKNEREI